jgi:EmrB/QacA subfamily drug resistance transporter
LPNKWTVFSIVALGVLMATIDSSIVNVSLPVISRSFGAPLGGLVEWVVIGYLVVVAALLLTAGRISDIVGRRATWGWGLVVFTAGSAMCGVAWSLEALVGCRALQGLGSALLMAVSPAMIVGAFPPTQRGRALGLNALVVGVGISIGPTLGGVVVQHFGWRSIFYVNVPLGVLAILATATLLPRDRPGSGDRVDWVGALLVALGLGGLTAVLSFGSELGWSSIPLLVGTAIALLALVGLGLHVRRVSQPVIDPGLFKNRVFASASASLLLSFVATFAVALLMAFYLEDLRGWPADRAGLLLTPLPLTSAIVSPASGAVADRIGSQKLAASGMLIAAVGLASISAIDEATGVGRLVAGLVIIGIGQAVFRAPNNSALMGSAPRDRQGVAAGVLATARVMGQGLSVALAGALFAAFGGAGAARALRRGEQVPAGAPVVDAFVRGLHAALVGCALVALLASGTALVRGRARSVV